MSVSPPPPGYFNKTLLHAWITNYSRLLLLIQNTSTFRLLDLNSGWECWCWEFLNELHCTMSVRLITIVFISEQPDYVYSLRSHLLQQSGAQNGKYPVPGPDHFVSSSEVTFDIKLLIEVGTDRVRGLCNVIIWNS